MASAEMTLRLLDLPEVQKLLESLREVAVSCCHGFDEDAGHRRYWLLADGFKESFVDGFGWE